MGKLFCLSGFVRKVKATKAKPDKETFQPFKDMGDPCGLVDTTLLIKSPLVVDSPDSCSTWSESALSKDPVVDQRECISGVLQMTASPDPQSDLDGARNVSTELVAPADTHESHKDLPSWSLLGPNICMKEEASVRLNEAVSRICDESQGLHITRLCPDAQGECADVSEDSTEVLESRSNPSPCGDFIMEAGESKSLDACLAEYFEPGNRIISLSQSYSMDGEHPNDVIPAGYEIVGATTSAGFFYSPNTASNKSDRTLQDDEILTGHVSDPGVYDRDERQSVFEPSVLQSNRTIAPSETTEPMFIRKSESDSYICELVPSERNVETAFAETGEHFSSPTELTFSSSDKATLKPESSSKALDSSMHNSWLKRFERSHRNIHVQGLKEASNTVVFGGEDGKAFIPMTGNMSDIYDMGHSEHNDVINDALVITEGVGKTVFTENHYEHGHEDGGPVLDMGEQASYKSSLWPSKEWIAFPTAKSGLSRVEEWILNIQESDVPAEEGSPSENKELSCEICMEEGVDVSNAMQKTAGAMSLDVELANAAVRSLNPFSTVVHIAGMGLREVPSLAKFNSLKTLNLSANNIVRVPTGCLPRSLHTLDFSRNRIGVIEGFRELSRLRVLNLSYNRISRIGHGLANCTGIKELYLVGNKIAEVEGLHRLLKLSILDLSFNKLTTAKTLGQLAANYSSLVALNLLGNPVHMNIGEEQLRKLVLSFTPHVTYLNKQPIKAVPAREVVVDSVARAALGTFQRNNKSSGTRASKKLLDVRSTHQQKKSHSRHSKDAEGRRSSLFPESESSKPARLPTQHRHHRQHNDGCQTEREVAKEYGHSSNAPMSVHEHFLQRLVVDQGMHRSRSDSALQDQV